MEVHCTQHSLHCIQVTDILNKYLDSLNRFHAVLNNEEHLWDEDQFVSRNSNIHWNSLDNHTEFFDRVADHLGLKKPEDWYTVNQSQVYECGGISLLLTKYGASLPKALITVYPNVPWKVWLFRHHPHGMWNELSTRKQYFDWLGEQLGIKNLEEWYNVTKATVISHHGTGIMAHYGRPKYTDTVCAAVCDVYPQHKWLPWKFEVLPYNFWDNSEHITQYLDWLGEQLGINKLEDWYKHKDHVGIELAILPKRFHRSLSTALQEAYPQHKWRFPEDYVFNSTNSRST